MKKWQKIRGTIVFTVIGVYGLLAWLGTYVLCSILPLILCYYGYKLIEKHLTKRIS